MLPFACVNRSISRTIESCQEGRQTSLQDLFGCLSLRAPPAPIQFLVVVQANLHREGRDIIRDWRDFTDSCSCIFRLWKAGDVARALQLSKQIVCGCARETARVDMICAPWFVLPAKTWSGTLTPTQPKRVPAQI